MTIQNYGQVFSDKTENDINYILANVFKFSITGKRLYEIILFLAALGTLSIYVNAKIWKNRKKCGSGSGSGGYWNWWTGLL